MITGAVLVLWRFMSGVPIHFQVSVPWFLQPSKVKMNGWQYENKADNGTGARMGSLIQMEMEQSSWWHEKECVALFYWNTFPKKTSFKAENSKTK